METPEQIITWLRDAHAMERSMEAVLERHAGEAEQLPAVREQLELHRQQTREHARRLEESLASLGATGSLAKDASAGMVGAIQGMSTALFRDEMVKNALAEYAMVHFEIACYSSLIAAAEEAGLVDIAHTCSDILREETRMAIWLEEEIPKITRAYLQQVAPNAG
jgi:ferritin-like metal-binding protein YciE